VFVGGTRLKRFDQKFGADLLSGLPQSPAVYLFRDESGDVLYAGKAKNIRRRLANYRNASRRKAHRKMRAIVRDAHSVEVRLQPSEAEALLVENELIRELRPRFNVDGAFDFLYPAIGMGSHEGRLILCFTSEPEIFEELKLSWHGSFRPRSRASDAFDALVSLLGRLGHVEPASRRPSAPRRKGSRLVAIRRVSDVYLALTRSFLNGEDDALLGVLSTDLLDSAEARRAAQLVQEELRFLEDFYGHDVRRLRDVRLAMGHEGTFVPREERDRLFIQTRTECAERTDSGHQPDVRPS
jgi:predicted GIY-YIG superfamily endonuclease